MIAEISAAMAAIKETAVLAKVLNDAKTDAEVKSATDELQRKLISLQIDCLTLADVIRLREVEVSHLKAQIAEFENFTSESEGYVLHRTEGASLLYSRQFVVDGVELMVNACPNCFHHKKISILQPGTEKSVKGSFWVHFCPSCKSEFKMDKTPPPNAIQKSTRRFPPGYSGW